MRSDERAGALFSDDLSGEGAAADLIGHPRQSDLDHERPRAL
jgi:hypothetical protein